MANHLSLLCFLLAIVLMMASIVDCNDGQIKKKKATDQAKDVKDRGTFEAIVAIHAHLDDDRSGNVDINETQEFLRQELHLQNDHDREETLHANDKFISVEDLWNSWTKNEARNWSSDDVIFWLEWSIGLPEYSNIFEEKRINGSHLPALATNHHSIITSILGIKDLHHRQKITLRAMDVVLFGPPSGSNLIKDGIVTISLLAVIIAVIYSNVQQRKVRKQRERMQKMLMDVESLQDAETRHRDTLNKLNQANEQQQHILAEKRNMENRLKTEVDNAKAEATRLKEEREHSEEHKVKLMLAEKELEQVREALENVEKELEWKSWNAPARLKELLRKSYDIEERYYDGLEASTNQQLQLTVEESEKIQKMYKKRMALLGTVRAVHGNQMNDIERKILSARKALNDYKISVEEKSKRWDEIELICGFRIRDDSTVLVKDRFNDFNRLSQSKDSYSSKYTDDYVTKLQYVNSGSFSSGSSGASQNELTDLVKAKTETKLERDNEIYKNEKSKDLLAASLPLTSRGHSSNTVNRPNSVIHDEKLDHHNRTSHLPHSGSQESFLISSKHRQPGQGSDTHNATNDNGKSLKNRRVNSVLEDDNESVKSFATDSSTSEKKKKKKKGFNKIFKSS